MVCDSDSVQPRAASPGMPDQVSGDSLLPVRSFNYAPRRGACEILPLESAVFSIVAKVEIAERLCVRSNPELVRQLSKKTIRINAKEIVALFCKSLILLNT
jgi:hypothetical protein